MQRLAEDEAFGNFCHRIGIPVIEEYMAEYKHGCPEQMVYTIANDLQLDIRIVLPFNDADRALIDACCEALRIT